MYLAAKQSLPLLLGGIEREYALVYPRPEGEDEHFHWRLAGRVIDALEVALAERGVWIKHLLTAGSGLAGYVLPDGGCVSCEGPNVLEVSSPETHHARTALAYLDDYRGFFARMLHGCGDLPARTLLCEGPASLPRFEPGAPRRFDLAFHLNFSLRLGREQAREFCTVLAALAPLLGCGGLTLRGFSRSPRGFAVRQSLCDAGRPWWREEMVRQAGRRDGYGGAEERGSESRFHVSCLDSPMTRRMAAFLFEACQLLLALVLYGRGPLRGKRLACPERACVALSGGETARRFELQGGGTVGMWGLHEAVCGGLEEVRRDFALKPAQERAMETLLAGLRALRGGDEEELAGQFDGYLRKRIYRALLENEGVSIPFFNRVAVPAAWHASRICSGLPEIAALSPAEAEKMVRNGREKARRKLLSLLGRDRLSPRDLPSLARLVQRMLTLEIRLHQLYPRPSPLAEYEEGLWNAYLEQCGPLPDGLPPTRAGMRGKLVTALGEIAGCRCRAEWSGIYVLAPHDLVGVFSLPDPHRPQASFRWVEIPVSGEHVTDGGLLDDLAASRYLLFPEMEEYGETAQDEPPRLPDEHPLLKALRFGIPEEQMPLFDANDMERCGFYPGRPRHVPEGQFHLF